MNVNSLGFSGSFLAKNEGWTGSGGMKSRVAGVSEGGGTPFCVAECCKLLMCLLCFSRGFISDGFVS